MHELGIVAYSLMAILIVVEHMCLKCHHLFAHKQTVSALQEVEVEYLMLRAKNLKKNEINESIS